MNFYFDPSIKIKNKFPGIEPPHQKVEGKGLINREAIIAWNS
jgi:hypothetical protein